MSHVKNNFNNNIVNIKGNRKYMVYFRVKCNIGDKRLRGIELRFRTRKIDLRTRPFKHQAHNTPSSQFDEYIASIAWIGGDSRYHPGGFQPSGR